MKYTENRSGGNSGRLALVYLACLLTIGNLCSCSGFWGRHATYLATKQDIDRTKADTEIVDIRDLPLQYYPLLSKFIQLRRVQLYSEEGTLATDAKLKALAEVNLKNLIDINLLNCRLVTDEGILALSKMQSLKELQLEGTAITDNSANILCSMTNLSGVNVANCSGITLKGLKALAAADNLQEINFSADKLSQRDVLELFALFKKVNWCQIVDGDGRLGVNDLAKVATRRGFHLVVKPTGALQDMQSVK